MKCLTCLVLFLMIALSSCENPPTSTSNKPDTPPDTAYDDAYANRVGADAYGMKTYVMAFLKAGPNRDRDSLAAANLQAAHMANIKRMSEEGKLVLAGPFLDSGELRGIYLFNVETVEEARELTATDPAIKAGSLVMELKPWYGSAAMVSINELHGKLKRQ